MDMLSKQARKGRIVEIVRKQAVRSQEELAELLERDGIEATQATLSRDIRELGLVKVRGGYQLPGEVHSTPPDELLRRAFEQFVIRTAVSGNMLMIKTSPGNAHSIAVVLDAAQWPEVLGTVAGDDTVFILLRNSRFGKRVLGKFQEFSV
jgi:transcriptional regulator of arginine metabolism